MVSARKVLRSFLDDAVRMCARALERIDQAGVPENGDEAARVKELYYIVHTLKGTATMICGGDEIVRTLHRLEDSLAAGTAQGLWNDSSWLGMAREAIARTHDLIVALRESERAQGCEKTDSGLLTKCGSRLLWFTLANTGRVVSGCDLPGQDVLLIGGQWLPVFRGWLETERGEESFGVVVTTETGKVLVLVDDVLGVSRWSEACQQGALCAVDMLDRAPAQRAA